MRLLKCNNDSEFSLVDFFGNDIPEYAILSHRWGPKEVTLAGLIDGTGKGKASYRKIQFCGEQARRDGLQYFWVDTCCINKWNYTELSEAINSMFRWYQDATKCYVYLSDVSRPLSGSTDKSHELSWEATFRESVWFTRGWTLQELIAPASVEFFSKEGELLGNKASLERHICEITGIPAKALQGSPLSDFSVRERFSWVEKRNTTKEEDGAYSLLGIFDVHMPLIYGEGREHAFKRLRKEIGPPSTELDNSLLDHLPYAVEAPFNSSQRQHQPICLPNTRVDLLREIHRWADKDNRQYIFWLNGLAGTGKSTIAHTVARYYSNEKRLGASFFFSRGNADVSNAAKFVTSIAVQLASSVPNLQWHICDAISKNTNIASKGLRDQWNQLVLRPLSQLNTGPVPFPFIIVIDALDECEGDNDIRLVLQLFAEVNTLSTTQLQIFLTSRPETPIRLGFRKMPGIIHQDLVLHNMIRAVVDHDIAVFLRAQFCEIREEFDYLPADWPVDSKIKRLVQRADGLFIYAATVCRFIKGDGQWSPRDLLDVVLPDTGSSQSLKYERDIPSQSPTWELDEIYTQILQRSINTSQGGQDKGRVLQMFKQVVGSFAILIEQLPATTLAKLLHIRLEQVDLRVRHLHSILNIPQNPNQQIRFLHPSFRDFLLDKQRCYDQSFWVDERQAHRTLADNCIRLMSDSLKQDICNQEAPGTLVVQVEASRIKECLPLEVQYACLYWVQHFQKSDIQLCDHDQIHQFLQVYLLYWLEALSWIGKTSEGIIAITSLEAIIIATESPNLYAFVRDIKRFVLSGRSVIEQAPLQLYCSVLVFAPEKSIIRKEFKEYILPWIQKKPKVQVNWNAVLQTLEGHSGGVTSVAFSSNGRQVISGSDDYTVRLWDAITGAPLQTLEGHSSGVTSVAFSPDGKQVISGSYDNTVRLWDAVTGAPLQTLEGHSDWVTSVASSPDGKQVASGSDDYIIRLLDAITGAPLQTLEGHSRRVASVAFSPDGKQVVSGSDDYTVRLWDAVTGAPLQTLEGHSYRVESVAFSPDGKQVVSGSYDYTVRLWDAVTGAPLQTLEGHSYGVVSVAFSPDGKQVASGSYDRTIRLWDAITGAPLQTLECHSYGVTSAAFSPNNEQVVSGSYDYTVRLWDAITGAPLQAPEGHSDWVTSVAFSPDGKQAVSSSYDNTVRLWDAVTGAPLQTLEGHSGGVTLVAFSPDGKQVVSGSYDNTVRLWDAITGAPLQTLEGHSGGVTSVAFSPGGKQVISGSYDHTVRLWDAVTGAPLQTLEGHPCGVASVAFSSDNMLAPTLVILNEWLLEAHEKILWLPPDYRATSVAVWNRIIALRHSSGRVSFLELNQGLKLIKSSISL